MLSVSKSRVVKLRSSNNEIFEVEEAMAALSEPIKSLVDVIGVNHLIPLPEVNSKTLVMVIEWWKIKHNNASHQGTTKSTSNTQLIEEWEAEFVEELDQANVVIDLLCTANFLSVKELQDLMFQKLADLIKVKTVEEICELFPSKH
ncbi:unnamed protein product [Malus baccata var. baccata]|uniref:SKP1-like protein n=1 Tax=Malus domestica TaxID=3750 RepID=A0A498KJ63_MALDO|nr:SKP1-like protein 1 [Malus sylvestris]RXI07507.1 hypothetical protein DVH24_005280 [Malus domestica]